jgi:hypothetical protein
MARKIYYKIIDDGINNLTEEQWEEILRLQHWYNSEFIWTAGKLGFRMYAVFPNATNSSLTIDDLQKKIHERRQELLLKGLSENQMIHQLESEGLVFVQKGGYFDQCIASGFTRVAGNEFNAYLVCEFLLKTSMIASSAVISVYDEGEFIKTKRIKLSNTDVLLESTEESTSRYIDEIITHRHLFGIVDPAKYDYYPHFRTTISEFNDMEIEDKLSIVKDWNWLGYGRNFDRNGDDVQGFDLNKKVRNFICRNRSSAS